MYIYIYMRWFIAKQKQGMIAPWDKPNSPLAALTHLQSAVKECDLTWLSFRIGAWKKKRWFDWNKRLRVISQVQITLIQQCRSGTGTRPANQPPGNISHRSHRTHQWGVGGGLMDGKSRCALQFLTSLLIHPPDKFVQNLTLIYFYEGISLALDLGRGSDSGLS